MTKREIVQTVFEHRVAAYVPWSFGFTKEARDKLIRHYKNERNFEEALDDHLLRLGNDIGFFTELGDDLYQDVFGVIWDRTVDKDIGVVVNCVLPRPTLSGYSFPDPLDERFFEDIPGRLQQYGDRFRVFEIGFSLFERAWTLRGWENLMMDFYDHPDFVRSLLDTIAEYNIAQIEKAMEYEIDAVYFGDDWGQQHGLQMGPAVWREFLQPALEKMFRAAKDEGKYVMIHSCGDVDELFDELIRIGLDCFNPFQPEVMDVFGLMQKYRGRLSFFGGLSTQKTLPYGTPQEVRRATERMIREGRKGSYVLAPAHDVEGDVPLENMLAFIETVQEQLDV